MIQDIEIKNFRCFDETKISGFTRVNLIGGKNNSGKTALLEALYLYSLPIPESILFLRQLRKESDTFSQAFPDQAWGSSRLCLSEVMTIAIAFQGSGYKTFKEFYLKQVLIEGRIPQFSQL